MNAIEHWKIVIYQANKAFSCQQLSQAETLYRQALHLLLDSWPDVAQRSATQPKVQIHRLTDDELSLLVICLSISVQNLAETYVRQQRWRRCTSLLQRASNQLQQAQNSLPADHPASVALLKEGCRLRREFCRFSQLQPQPVASNDPAMAPASILAQASVRIH